VVNGSEVQNMYLASVGFHCEHNCPGRGPGDVPRNTQGQATFDPPSAFANNSRGLTLPKDARQVTLNYLIGECKDDCSVGQLIVSLGSKPVTSPAPANLVTPKSASLVPHFSLIRSIEQVAESGGTAFITVGIQNLKDQTATVTVNSADIVSAKDGAGNSLPVQVGNNVVVTQDTSITFQVRNYTLGPGINVSAEGKNGTVSAGALSFSQPFVIVKDSTNGGNSAPKSN
jgi:hypothetical protein